MIIEQPDHIFCVNDQLPNMLMIQEPWAGNWNWSKKWRRIDGYLGPLSREVKKLPKKKFNHWQVKRLVFCYVIIFPPDFYRRLLLNSFNWMLFLLDEHKQSRSQQLNTLYLKDYCIVLYIFFIVTEVCVGPFTFMYHLEVNSGYLVACAFLWYHTVILIE